MVKKSSSGNIAVDMIIDGCNHYKQFHKKVKMITLSYKYWTILEGYVKDNNPELIFHEELALYSICHFHKDVLIRKGHRFMTEPMEFDVVKDIIKAEA